MENGIGSIMNGVWYLEENVTYVYAKRRVEDGEWTMGYIRAWSVEIKNGERSMDSRELTMEKRLRGYGNEE